MKDLVKYIFEKIEEEICEDQIEEEDIEEASVVGNIGGPSPALGGNSRNPGPSTEDKPLPKNNSKKSVQNVLSILDEELKEQMEKCKVSKIKDI